MKEAGSSARPARPWHVIWSPAIPVLALLSGNFGGLMPQAAIRSLVLTVGISVTATLILGRLVRNYQRAALAVSAVIPISLSMATAWELSTRLNFPLLPPLLLLWAILLAGYFLRVPKNTEGLTAFANALTLCTVIFVAWPTVVQQTRRWRQPTVTFGAIDIPAALPDRPRPDIYILILDAYGRADVLRDYYHFENTLVPELEKLGFNVPPKAASNYAQTALSLASSLNLEYLPTLLEKQVSVGEPRARLADLISRNRVFDTFTAAGYRIRSYSSEYGLLQPQIVDERPHPILFMTDFEYGFYEATALPMLFAMAGRPVATIPFALHRHHIRWTLDHLRRDLPATNDPPTLVFAHLLIPHPPFSFEPDGSPLESRLPANFNDGSHWQAQAEGRGETYEAGYTKAIQFVNNAVLDIVRNVVSRPDGRQTIFYIEGDHGPGSRLDWEDPSKTDARERLAILMAARFPNPSPESKLPAWITPVNSFRRMLNEALGTRLPLLEDHSYFSRWNSPLGLMEVTDRVR